MEDKERVVYWKIGDNEAQFVPEHEARISIYDSALMYGDMVFEMTRSFLGKQFKLKEHIKRLYNSAKCLYIDIPMTMEEMEEAVLETVKRNRSTMEETDEDRVMIEVSRGLLGLYQDVVGIQKGANVIIASFPLRWTVSDFGRLYDTGINAVVVSQRAIPASLLDPKIKNRSRIHYFNANAQAGMIEGKDNWAILLDTEGLLAEGTGDNVFLVKDGVIMTPKGKNCLRGISREYVFELARKNTMRCIEKDLDSYDAMTADEIFITGTPFCILPVTKFNGQVIGGGKMGWLTRKLLDLWSASVGVDIEMQIKSWTDSKKPTGVTPYSFKVKK